MNLSHGILPETWNWIAAILFVLGLAFALRRAPWGYLREERNLHVFLGACVALMLMWTVRGMTIPGLGYHYFGATLLTLMFGWQLAFAAITVVLVGTVFNDVGDWLSLPVNALVMGALPIAVSHFLWRFSERRLPNNYFVYVFVCAYFGAAFAFLAAALAASGLLLVGSHPNAEQLFTDFFPLVFLMAFPEAFITGFIISLLAVYRPAWVRTFADERYLKGK